MRIESFASTQTGMDRLRYPTSRSEHVCSNRNLRRLWHQPEHGSSSRNHAHRRFGRSATLARTRWPVDKDGLPAALRAQAASAISRCTSDRLMTAPAASTGTLRRSLWRR